MSNKEEDIIAVAIFMGWQRGLFENLPNKLHKMEDGELLGMPIDQFNYNTSWDALMPVVKNIALTLSKTGSVLLATNKFEEIIDGLLTLEVDEVFTPVVKYIKWFNTQSSKTDKP